MEFIFKEAFFMPFNRKPQKFNAAIKSVVIGSGDKTVTLGGENVLPFYSFDGEIKNGPKVGVEITDFPAAGISAFRPAVFQKITSLDPLQVPDVLFRSGIQPVLPDLLLLSHHQSYQ